MFLKTFSLLFGKRQCLSGLNPHVSCAALSQPIWQNHSWKCSCILSKLQWVHSSVAKKYDAFLQPKKTLWGWAALISLIIFCFCCFFFSFSLFSLFFFTLFLKVTLTHTMCCTRRYCMYCMYGWYLHSAKYTHTRAHWTSIRSFWNPQSMEWFKSVQSLQFQLLTFSRGMSRRWLKHTHTRSYRLTKTCFNVFSLVHSCNSCAGVRTSHDAETSQT